MEKANRNDPCPCGSGKKYKKCCGMKEGGRTFQAVNLTGTASKMSSFFKRQESEKEAPPATGNDERKKIEDET